MTASLHPDEMFPLCDLRHPAGRCLVAERIASQVDDTTTTECRVMVDQCQKCVSLANARDVNEMTVGVACFAFLQRDDKRAAVRLVELFNDTIPRERKFIPTPSGGAGSELKAILSFWFRIKSDAGCHCDELAAEMDTNGPDWCRSNMGTIVNKMKWNAKALGITFNRLAAMALVNLAIRRAERKIANELREVPEGAECGCDSVTCDSSPASDSEAGG